MSYTVDCGCVIASHYDAALAGTVVEYCSDHERQRKPKPELIKGMKVNAETIHRLNNTITGLRQKNEEARKTIKQLRDAAKKVPSQDDLLKRNALLVKELCAASALIADLQTTRKS